MPETTRCWLVNRTYSDKGLVSLTYATPDGERALHRERSPRALERQGVTAAVDAEDETLVTVDGADERERYAAEATRMAEKHDPADTV